MVNDFDEVSELELEHATVNNRLKSTKNRARLFAKKRTFLFDFVFMILPFSAGRGGGRQSRLSGQHIEGASRKRTISSRSVSPDAVS